MPSFDANIPSPFDTEIVKILLYDIPPLNSNQNYMILRSAILFILQSQRLNGSLL